MAVLKVLIPVVVALVFFRIYSSQSSVMMSVRARNLSSKAIAGHGRNAVVVGATSGIGQACALRLAEAGYTVTAVGRDSKRGEDVVKAMNQLNTNTHHNFVSCDAFGLKSIEKCTHEIIDQKKIIDVLILSQGMATIQGFTPTVEGNDQKLTLHYWGRMAMITQLLPSLRRSQEPRVVSILSGGVHSAFVNYQQDPELRESYSIKNAADAAGFYNDLGLDALAHDPKNKEVMFVHAAPGFVNTNWGTEMPWWIRYPVRVLQPLGRTAQDCAEAMCFPCFSSKSDLIAALAPPNNISNEASNENKETYHQKEKDWVNSVLVMGPHTERASVTDLHSEAASQFIWQKTLEVFKNAGMSSPV